MKFICVFIFVYFNILLDDLIKNLTDTDVQKNLLSLATTLAELQEQNRSIQPKINEIDKRGIGVMRERDQILLENSRISASKTKLESLCRELHRHNQQMRVMHCHQLLIFVFSYGLF